jgi:hypothetical protein
MAGHARTTAASGTGRDGGGDKDLCSQTEGKVA